jgi:hypothetical protein
VDQPERGPAADVAAGPPPTNPETAGESFSAVTRWLAAREARPTWRRRWATFLVRMHWPLIRAGLSSAGRVVVRSMFRCPRRWAAGAGGGVSGLALMCLMWAWPAPATTPDEDAFVGLGRVQTLEVAPTLPPASTSIAATTPASTPAPPTTPAAMPVIEPQPQLPPVTPEPPVAQTPESPSPFYVPADTRPADGDVRQAGFATSNAAANPPLPAAWLTGTIETSDDGPASFESPPRYEAFDAAPSPFESTNVRSQRTETGFVPAQYDEAISPASRSPRSVPVRPSIGDAGPVIEPRPADRQPVFVAPR